VLGALESVLSVILMIGLGFVLAKKGWFEEKSASLISRLVVGVALPAYMIANLMGGYDRAKLLSMLPGLPIPFAVMVSTYAIGAGTAALFRLPRGRRGSFASMFALSNTIFIGLPVNLVLFGEESLPYVLLYYIANTSLFWTLGVYGIAKDGAILAGRPPPSLVSAEGLRRILSPPLVAFLAAVAMIAAGIGLPRPIMDSCKSIGAMTTPLSMLFIGIVISRVEWKRLRLERDLVLLLAGRFVLSPLILVLLARGTGLPPLMKAVFLVQASMPAMTQTPILAESYGADSEYAGLATSVTTVLSLATIPVFKVLAGNLF
jgi:malate permease and related proteins